MLNNEEYMLLKKNDHEQAETLVNNFCFGIDEVSKELVCDGKTFGESLKNLRELYPDLPFEFARDLCHLIIDQNKKGAL